MNVGARNNLIMFFSGYVTHKFKRSIRELSIQYDRKIKTAVVFGKPFENIARDNLNFFHYKFSYWSSTFNRYLTGNRLLFNKDEIQWKELDRFVEEA